MENTINYNDRLIIERPDSDEDDCEGYFLQSSSNGYDIKEKIKAANEQLFESYEQINGFREQRVTFNDAVDYEPYYSSDDGYVQSPYALGSDNEIDNDPNIRMYHTIQEEIIEEIQDLNLGEYQEKKNEIVEEIFEEEILDERFTENDIIEKSVIEEKVIEERVYNYIDEYSEHKETEYYEELLSDEYTKSDDNIIELINNDEDLIDETDLEVSIIHCDEESPKIPKVPKKKKSKEEKIEINCRLHCLEKKDLDAISKGCDTNNIKTSTELNLKLKPKRCCKNQEKPKLPVYNGLVSEYGLSEKQIEKKKLRDEKRKKLKKERLTRVKEEKIQRDLCNEEIFCAWLKSVEQRNKQKCNKNCFIDQKNNKVLTPNNKRPKSAYEYKNENIYTKKRPMTSPTKCQHYNTIILHPGVTLRTRIC